ncbi:DUF6785 family protein [Candidatus Poribacteria bacterium]
MHNKKDLQEDSKIRLSLILVGAVLVMANSYWIAGTWNGALTQVSLFLNAVFVTFLIGLLNVVLRRINQRLALRPSEIIVIYIMLAIGTAASGHDTVEMLTQIVGYPFWFASAENEWEDLFLQYIPRWIILEDKNVLEGFHNYDGEFYDPTVFKAWLYPLLFWASFLVALYFCMMCINIIFQKQWMDRERLSFPIARVPLGLADPKLPFYKEKLFWYAFGGAMLLSLVNGLHRLYPAVPGPTYGKFDLSALFTEKPWNVIEGVYIEFLPFVLGFAFFIPMSLSFSIWFFFWFWKMEMVLGSAVGVHYLPGFPGYGGQGMGAVMLMFAMFVFWSKRHLWQVLRAVFRARSSEYSKDAPLYTFALLGIILSMIFLVSFCYYAGMKPWVSILFFGVFYVVTTVLTRARAELGPPTHDFPFVPTDAITNFLGTKMIDGSSLTNFAMLKFVDYGNRSSVMPHTLEALYLKDRLKVRQTWLVITAMIVAIILGSSAGLMGNVHRGYRDTAQIWAGRGFPRLADWLKYPSGTDYLYIVYCIIGAAITMVLATLNRYFVWWPFHPLGYILGGEWMLRYFWFSIFLAWMIKWIILKYGGMKAHRKAVPIFIGITVGDATMIALWSIYGTAFNRWTIGLLYW